MTNERHFTSNNSEELIEKIRNRYKIEGKPLSKFQAYKRLDKAGVKAHKQNNQTWLDDEQFTALEELDKHIRSGGSMHDFGAMILQDQKTIDNQNTEQQSQHQNELIAEEIVVLDRNAQEKAAGILIAESLITADYLNNWQLLDEDLRKEVQEVKITVLPKKTSPKQFAEAALSAVRKCRSA